jgi:PAP2 superfamily
MLRRSWSRELLLFLAAYAIYGLARYAAIGNPAVAADNARWIVDLEHSIGVDVEGAVQRALGGSAALWVLNHIYIAAQFVVLPGALAWLYRRSRTHYRGLRDTVLATWLVSVPVYALFPVAPPRLADIGLIDTITTQTGFALDPS